MEKCKGHSNVVRCQVVHEQTDREIKRACEAGHRFEWEPTFANESFLSGIMGVTVAIL